MSLLHINDLSIRFPSQSEDRLAVHKASLSVAKGVWLALVGESGSGKSVTAQAILRLLPDYAHISGEIHFDGQDVLALTPSELRKLRGSRISMIFQEPMTALNPLHTIGRQISEIIDLHQKLNKADTHARVLEVLEMVGLSHFASRLDAYPHQLSGGERQRVMIAMAMANRPDLLIADEPTTALDVTLQRQILRLLKELQQKHGMAILLITHDLTIVRQLADRVAIMKQGEVVEQGTAKEVFAAPKHNYTQALLASEPKGHALPLPANAPELLHCEQLKVHFPIRKGLLGRVHSHVKAVDGVSLQLKAGQTIGIVGESGSGKTTLGLALLRLISSNGPIVFMGTAIDGLPAAALRPLRKQMQLVFQDPFSSLNPRLCVGQIIGEGLRVHHPEISREQRRQRAGDMLERIGLSRDMWDRFPHEFSGGQRQRISIARAMILKPSLVVLDEPTSALDLTVQTQILELLKTFQREEGCAYLFISHDLRVIRTISHEVMVMHKGKVVEHQATEKLFESPQQDYTRELLAALNIA